MKEDANLFLYDYAADEVSGKISFGTGDEKYELLLTASQAYTLDSRFAREFVVLCKKEKILSLIEAAGTVKELEEIALKHYACDVCDLGKINLYGAKRILSTVVRALYEFPRLRNATSFIGSRERYAAILEKIRAGDGAALASFGLQYLCADSETANALGKMTAALFDKMDARREFYVAAAVSAFGFFDALVLDGEDYDGYAYLNMVNNLRRGEESGFHPRGCSTPESVVWHEIGHLLDGLCELSSDEEFCECFESLTAAEIESGLSRYAVTSAEEFVAEAFSEYMTSPSPRPLAAKFGGMLKKAYGALPR